MDLSGRTFQQFFSNFTSTSSTSCPDMKPPSKAGMVRAGVTARDSQLGAGVSRTQSEVPSGFKIAYDPEDDPLHLQKRIQNTFRFKYPRYIECHRKLEIDESVLLRAGDSEEFVAGFQHADLGSGDKQIHRRIKLTGMRFDPILYDLLFFTWHAEVAEMRSADPEDFTVLVESVKFMKEPQCIVPPFVWLTSLDISYSVWPHALYAFLQKSLRVFIQWTPDGETGVSLDFSCVGTDQLTSQMVKTSPEIMKGISDVTDDISGIRRPTSEIVDVLSGLRILFLFDSVGVGIEKPFHCDVKICDVVIGPFCFEQDGIHRSILSYLFFRREFAFVVHLTPLPR
jgi:hypothetical protein